MAAAASEKRRPQAAATAGAGCQGSDAGASPCQGTANFVLDLLGELLQERAGRAGGRLEIGEILSIVESFKSAPGGLSGFYDSTFRRCHAPQEVTPTGAADFLQAVTRLLAADGGTLPMGRIETLGLEDIRAEMGAGWPRLEGMVHRIARSVIAERLADEDCFARSANGGYLICYAQLSAEEAWFKTCAIGREIKRRILGQDETEQPPGLALSEAHLTRSSQVAPFAEPVDFPAPDHLDDSDILDLVDARLKAARSRILQRAKTTIREIERSASITPDPVLTLNGTRSNLQIARLDIRSRSKAEQLLACVEADPAVPAQLDLITLAQAAGHANRRGKGDQSLLIVDVRLATMAQPLWAERYLRACRQVTGRASRSLVFNLKGCTAATPAEEIEAHLRLLAPYSRLRMLTLAGPCRGHPSPPAASLHLLAVDFSDIPNLDGSCSAAAAKAEGSTESSLRLLVENAVHGTPIHQLRRFGATFFTYEAG